MTRNTKRTLSLSLKLSPSQHIEAQWHRHARMTHLSFSNLITSHLWFVLWITCHSCLAAALQFWTILWGRAGLGECFAGLGVYPWQQRTSSKSQMCAKAWSKNNLTPLLPQTECVSIPAAGGLKRARNISATDCIVPASLEHVIYQLQCRCAHPLQVSALCSSKGKPLSGAWNMQVWDIQRDLSPWPGVAF